MTKITWNEEGKRTVDGVPEDRAQEVYIIVWTDGTIESVWTNEQLAKTALETHALESEMPESYYHIVKRRLNYLKASETLLASRPTEAQKQEQR